MNEITRIHIAKTAYDVEVTAKKQLEKYIKSVEVYTQDNEVVNDIEIRMTEILAERGVKAGGVISTSDVEAMRAQLGEPYEFAGKEGDIAIGAAASQTDRRLYRTTDGAVLGGVLGGIGAYLNINPVWVRLAFILLLFVSFGTVLLVYIVMWLIVPQARTATEKLQLAGKDITLESIRELNSEEDAVQAHPQTPILQQVLFVGMGIASILGGIVTFLVTAWLIIGAATFSDQFVNMTNGMTGLGDGNMWIVWLVFAIVVLGMLLLTALFGLVAYAFLKKKLNKRIVVSGVIIVALGLASFATVLGISTSQSWRVANETRSMVRETKANLPKEFANVKTAEFTINRGKSDPSKEYFFSSSVSIRYVVDDGPARYELSALPTTKPAITVDGTNAKIAVTVPESFRNSFVLPALTIYGPALDAVTSHNVPVEYAGVSQQALAASTDREGSVTVSGSYETIIANGNGSIDLTSGSVRALTVTAQHQLNVTAGTVRDLTVTQPDVCPSNSYDTTRVTVTDVSSGSITYNGRQIPVESYTTSCASVTIESQEAVEQNEEL